MNISGALKGTVKWILIGFMLFFAAVFSFLLFYWLMVPPSSHFHPVYFVENTATVITQLNEGKEYLCTLELVLSDSEHNRNAGNFFATLRGKTVHARPGLFPHRSRITRYLSTLVSFPLFFIGLLDESKKIGIVLEERFGGSAEVTLALSKTLEIKSAFVRFETVYSGLRYYLYYWFYFCFVGYVLAFMVNGMGIALIVNFLATSGSQRELIRSLSEQALLEQSSRAIEPDYTASSSEEVSENEEINARARNEERSTSDEITIINRK